MATIAPIVGALAFIAFAIGLVMFLPLPALKPHRRTAKWLVIGGFVSFVVALIVTPTPPAADAATAGATESETSELRPDRIAPQVAAATPVAGATADAADDIDLALRQTIMPVIFCSGEVENLQTAVDRASSGSGTPMQAYSAAHIAERDCQKMVRDYAEFKSVPFKTGSLNEIYARTLPACRAVPPLGVRIATIAKAVLDENASMKRAQEYKDLRAEAFGKVAECKLGLQGVGETAGLPPEALDFLNP